MSNASVQESPVFLYDSSALIRAGIPINRRVYLHDAARTDYSYLETMRLATKFLGGINVIPEIIIWETIRVLDGKNYDSKLHRGREIYAGTREIVKAVRDSKAISHAEALPSESDEIIIPETMHEEFKRLKAQVTTLNKSNHPLDLARIRNFLVGKPDTGELATFMYLENTSFPGPVFYVTNDIESLEIAARLKTADRRPVNCVSIYAFVSLIMQLGEVKKEMGIGAEWKHKMFISDTLEFRQNDRNFVETRGNPAILKRMFQFKDLAGNTGFEMGTTLKEYIQSRAIQKPQPVQSSPVQEAGGAERMAKFASRYGDWRKRAKTPQASEAASTQRSPS